MKVISFLIAAAAFAMASCTSGSPGLPVDLNKTAMTFNQEGADFGECGLVSQFEKGRASSSQAAGGG
jgi:hypothetical protein